MTSRSCERREDPLRVNRAASLKQDGARQGRCVKRVWPVFVAGSFELPVRHFAFDYSRVCSEAAGWGESLEEFTDDVHSTGWPDGQFPEGGKSPGWAMDRRAIRNAATKDTGSGSVPAWIAASHVTERIA